MSDSIDMVSSIWSGETSSEGSTALSASSVTKPRALAVLMNFLTAASDRSRSGLSFSGASAWRGGLLVGLRCHCHSITPEHAAAAQRAEENFNGVAANARPLR